ncbi:MAG: hypothetical protein SGJ13_01520 [Actinomycetota bacterium]|nr:hypothetical protein [Actinomycetota bacterium]
MGNDKIGWNQLPPTPPLGAPGAGPPPGFASPPMAPFGPRSSGPRAKPAFVWNQPQVGPVGRVIGTVYTALHLLAILAMGAAIAYGLSRPGARVDERALPFLAVGFLVWCLSFTVSYALMRGRSWARTTMIVLLAFSVANSWIVQEQLRLSIGIGLLALLLVDWAFHRKG